jgi:cytosine/adenosine deaminase-related metal-dependent hydrolase
MEEDRIRRTDPDLIAVIEELKDEANGRSAKIRIAEIPDDVEWHIAEYDGFETIAENHRTW